MLRLKSLASILEQSVDINFIKIDLNFKKTNNNSEEEVKDFYDENQIRFFSEEKRTFKYFVLQIRL